VTATPTPLPTPLTADAERAVLAMNAALANADQDSVAYLQTISPISRSKIKPENVFRSLIVSMNIRAYGPVSIDLSSILTARYYDVTVQGEFQQDGYVIVRANGWVNLLNSFSLETCDLWDVRRYEDGQWLVDVEAPERQLRIERIVRARLAAHPELANLPFLLLQPLGQLSQGVDKVLLLCEGE
jgi:hypothetical protein